MKRRTRWTALAAGLALTLTLAGATAAAGGDQADPLITLSYLNQTVVPQILDQVDLNAEQKKQELDKSFRDQVARYRGEMETSITDRADGTASYVLVTMQKGQTMSLEVGCELMLRVGSAKMHSDSNPALIDITTGENVKKGTSLVKNHLYMATIPERTVTAEAATVKLLVRGNYTVA